MTLVNQRQEVEQVFEHVHEEDPVRDGGTERQRPREVCLHRDGGGAPAVDPDVRRVLGEAAAAQVQCDRLPPGHPHPVPHAVHPGKQPDEPAQFGQLGRGLHVAGEMHEAALGASRYREAAQAVVAGEEFGDCGVEVGVEASSAVPHGPTTTRRTAGKTRTPATSVLAIYFFHVDCALTLPCTTSCSCSCSCSCSRSAAATCTYWA